MFLFNPGSGNNFVGREKEIQIITEQFCLGKNVVLSAPRRFGKTTMILEILSRLKERNFFTAYIDIFPVTSVNHLSAEIAEAVLTNLSLHNEFAMLKSRPSELKKHANFKLIAENYDFLLRFGDKAPDNYQLLSDCLDFAEQLSIRYKKRMVCVFDEFGDLKKFDNGKLFKLIKSKIQKHINTSYLFSGSYDSVIHSLFEGSKAPFLRLARKVNLEEIGRESLVNLYKTNFADYHIDFPEVLTEKILDFTGGHPYYSQLALQEVILHHLVYEKIPEFETLLHKMAVSEKDYLEKTWEDIATSRQNIKTILAVTKGSTGIYSSLRNSNVNIYRSLKTLSGNGTLLVNPDKTYRMSDPLLNYWIKKNVHRLDIKITKNEI